MQLCNTVLLYSVTCCCTNRPSPVTCHVLVHHCCLRYHPHGRNKSLHFVLCSWEGRGLYSTVVVSSQLQSYSYAYIKMAYIISYIIAYIISSIIAYIIAY